MFIAFYPLSFSVSLLKTLFLDYYLLLASLNP
jgi:hypothetical protein